MRTYTGHVLIQASRKRIFDYVSNYENHLKWGKNSLYTFTLILPQKMPEDQFRAGIRGLDEELSILKKILEAENAQPETKPRHE